MTPRHAHNWLVSKGLAPETGVARGRHDPGARLRRGQDETGHSPAPPPTSDPASPISSHPMPPSLGDIVHNRPPVYRSAAAGRGMASNRRTGECDAWGMYAPIVATYPFFCVRRVFSGRMHQYARSFSGTSAKYATGAHSASDAGPFLLARLDHDHTASSPNRFYHCHRTDRQRRRCRAG